MSSQSCPLTTPGPCTQGLKPLLPTPSKSSLKEKKRRQLPAIYRVSFTQWDRSQAAQKQEMWSEKIYGGWGGNSKLRANSLFLWPPMVPVMYTVHRHTFRWSTHDQTLFNVIILACGTWQQHTGAKENTGSSPRGWSCPRTMLGAGKVVS